MNTWEEWAALSFCFWAHRHPPLALRSLQQKTLWECNQGPTQQNTGARAELPQGTAKSSLDKNLDQALSTPHGNEKCYNGGGVLVASLQCAPSLESLRPKVGWLPHRSGAQQSAWSPSATFLGTPFASLLPDLLFPISRVASFIVW